MSGAIASNQDNNILETKIQLAQMLNIDYKEDFILDGIMTRFEYVASTQEIFLFPVFKMSTKDIKSLYTIGKAFNEVQTKIRSLE